MSFETSLQDERHQIDLAVAEIDRQKERITTLEQELADANEKIAHMKTGLLHDAKRVAELEAAIKDDVKRQRTRLYETCPDCTREGCSREHGCLDLADAPYAIPLAAALDDGDM